MKKSEDVSYLPFHHIIIVIGIRCLYIYLFIIMKFKFNLATENRKLHPSQFNLATENTKLHPSLLSNQETRCVFTIVNVMNQLYCFTAGFNIHIDTTTLLLYTISILVPQIGSYGVTIRSYEITPHNLWFPEEVILQNYFSRPTCYLSRPILNLFFFSFTFGSIIYYF